VKEQTTTQCQDKKDNPLPVSFRRSLSGASQQPQFLYHAVKTFVIDTQLIPLFQPYPDSVISVGRKLSTKLTDLLTKRRFVRALAFSGLIFLAQSITVGAVDTKGSRDLWDRITFVVQDPHQIPGLYLRPQLVFFLRISISISFSPMRALAFSSFLFQLLFPLGNPCFQSI
jgi:hypothetical protein